MLDLDPQAPVALVDFPGEDGEGGQRRRWTFRRPRQWLVAHDPSQVPALLDAAHAQARAGHWAVGWIAYEAAPGLNPDLPTKATAPGAVYAVWAIFEEAEPGWPPLPAASAAAAADWSMGPWAGPWSDADKAERIGRIHELIRQGEVYQINLTESLQAPWQTADATQPHAALQACFEALHRSQPDGYALYLDARAATRQPGVVMSVSPELFIDWHGPTLTARPMKGTAPRRWDANEDRQQALHLQRSDKERAENLMIVDLLRNDLSRVAETGSVKVPSLFDVQALPTVWQMTSTVTARALPDLRLSTLMRAIFPCGSVTGAPKRQAMHHIARLESSPRGVYCGAAGLMSPDGRVTFNVPIRTVSVHTLPPPAPWRAQCGIGSGITLDAQADAEIAEWRHKRAFLQRAETPFQLLESLRLDQGQLSRLGGHLARLRRAALYFGFVREAQWPALGERLTEALQHAAAAHASGTHKVRLLLHAHGGIDVEVQPLPPPAALVRVHWAASPMPEADAFIRHKTTHRLAYTAHQPPAGCFDTLLRNARGELTEFTIGNLALCVQGRWLTPATASGLLPGVMRGQLLDDGRLQEAVLTAEHLLQASEAALINSVRGWVKVDLADLQAQVWAASGD